MTLRDVKDSIVNTFIDIVNWFINIADIISDGSILDLTIGQAIFVIVILGIPTIF